MMLDDGLRARVQDRRGAGELRGLAIENGMETLLVDGVRQVREGVTTVEEVLRVATLG